MKPLFSVCFYIPENYSVAKLNFLVWQDWENVELLIMGEPPDIENFRKVIGDDLSCKISYFVQGENGCNEDSHLLQKSKGEFVIWLNPKEVWNRDFLLRSKEFLRKNQSLQEGQLKEPSKILYGIGFVRTNGETYFAAEILKKLKKTNKIYKNFSKPTYLSPCVKYFWQTNIVKDFNLSFPQSEKKQLIKEGLFTIDYFAAVYQQNNFTEPDFDFTPLGFLVRDLNYDSPEDLFLYRQHFLNKQEIWLKNPWQKIYWLCRFGRDEKKPR